MQTMHAANVVHFDLKCDNVLLEPLGARGEVWEPQPGTFQAPFRVSLGNLARMSACAPMSQNLSVANCLTLSYCDDANQRSHPSVLLRWCWQTLESPAPLAT